MGDLYPLPPNGFSVQGHNSDQKGLVAKIQELEAQLKRLKVGLSPALTDHAPSSDGNKLKDMAPYLVIDLSGGSRALHYPVSVLSTIPHCGWTDEYKTKDWTTANLLDGKGTASQHTKVGSYQPNAWGGV